LVGYQQTSDHPNPLYKLVQEGEDGRLVHDGLTEQQLELLAEAQAEEEEAHAVKEFAARLAYNMGEVRTELFNLGLDSSGLGGACGERIRCGPHLRHGR